jgi:hypothetical protein
MTNQNLEPEEPAGDVSSDPPREDGLRRGSDTSEDKGDKAGLAAILPLIIVSVLAILVIVWLVAR